MGKQLNLIIYGRVQGVGFRCWVQDKAREMSIVGRAKNEKNGSVTVIAQGETQALEKFLEMCYIGSALSSVTHSKAVWTEIKEKHETFEVI